MDGQSIIIRVIRAIPTKVAIFLIRMYQVGISPFLAGCCRFEPSCSQYGLIAFQRFGFIQGAKLTFKRLARCRPGGSYGYDPVPETLFGKEEG